MIDQIKIAAKVKAAGIESCGYSDGGELWLHHDGAARRYPDVNDAAALDAAIMEFKANVPPWCDEIVPAPH